MVPPRPHTRLCDLIILLFILYLEINYRQAVLLRRSIPYPMRHSIKIGFSFGLTSGIITTLGLLIGLYSGTGSRIAVLGGILTIAIADALSDALGIHVSEESENIHTRREIWESTLSTFFFKFIIAISFIVPFFIWPLGPAVIACVIWGMLLLGIFSFFISKNENLKPMHAVFEHLLIGAVVIAATYYIGEWISRAFS